MGRLSGCAGNTSTGKARFYYNPKGKSRKARRPVPMSERIIALLKGLQQEG